mgnify:CR=1 FL=1
MNGMPWCTEPFNFDGIHHDRIAVPDTLRVQDTISFLVISELGVIGMLRLQTGQHPVGSSQPSVHHPRRDDIQPLPPRYRAYPNTIQRYLLLSAPQNKVLTFGHISSVLRTNILCHLQFGTHQQESTNTVQVICDAGTVTVELIAANTSSDADMTDLDILILPFQAVHNAVKGTFCSINRLSAHHPRRDDIQPLPPRYRAYPNTIQRYLLLSAPQNKVLRQYRIILSADTASEVRQMLSQKRR